MLQKMEMYIVTMVDPGHSQTIQNIIHPRSRQQQNLLLNTQAHNPLRQNLLLNIQARNLQRLKARVMDPMTSLVADPLLPAKCQMLPATGQEAVPVRAPGVVVAQVMEVVDGVAEEEDSAVVEEDKLVSIFI
jgi:hypothetical protein